MQLIDEPRLETDLGYRFGYLTDFIGFGPADVAAIQGVAVALTPHVPALVDAVYDKLFSYDATVRHFTKRQHGFEGAVPANVTGLQTEDAVIEFRKKHLGRYVTKLVTGKYDQAMVVYLDFVGKMHTPKAGNPELDVPLVQMNALLGYVADLINESLYKLELPRAVEVMTVRAFSKLLWIQNDLIVRHYATN